MNGQAEARRRGWAKLPLPGYAIYARGGFRIQRSTRTWRWWNVILVGPTRYERGRTRTLCEALDAVDAIADAMPSVALPDTGEE